MKRKTRAPSVEASVQRTLAQTFDVANPRVSLVAGVAHLTGTVPSYRHKTVAGDTVRHLTGASQVVNRLRVTPSRSTGDRVLRETVLKALREQLKGDTADVSVLTHQGVIELKGTVASLAERCVAELAAWSVGGVIDVRNRLEVRGRASSPESLARQLRQALSQCLRLDITSFEVMARGDIVYLRGRVPSPQHRQAAEQLVRAHSQVREVINELSAEETSTATQVPRSCASA